MIEYMVKEVSGDVSSLEAEMNRQARFGWKLHSFEVAFIPGYLRYIVVFEKEKN